MTTVDNRGRLSTARHLITHGKGAGIQLTEREADTVLALMDGHTTTKALAAALMVAPGTVHFYFNQIYAKTGAGNHADLVLMITGVKVCPPVLLPVQRVWRRKHYKLDD